MQTKDYCTFAVIERLNDKLLLRHLKIFTQPMVYASVLAYVKEMQDRWDGFQKIRVHTTREGSSLIKTWRTLGIQKAEDVTFSVPRKSEIAGRLKQRMSSKQLFPASGLGETLPETSATR